MYKVGQKWVSENEPELGLGTIEAVNKFQITLNFTISQEKRTFSSESPPLKRVAYTVGEAVTDSDGIVFRIEKVEEVEGILQYHGAGKTVCETALSEITNFSKPQERILQGQVDTQEAFRLRFECLKAYGKARQSSVSGFLGGRIDLIPHQLYIANEVANRFCPRVLLSDEVGLGKTIEACLILHRLHLTGRAARILIVVPESLVHQWFIELYRRFNLWFTIMDSERCSALSNKSKRENPFLEDQLILCSIKTLTSDGRLGEVVSDVNWDLLVVDEAHHYEWGPGSASIEYEVIEALSNKSHGLILLTATPEQMGTQGHFARLRLLDKDRYPSLDKFVKEQADYHKVAELANRVYKKQPLSQKQKEDLKNRLSQTLTDDLDELLNNSDELLEALVDRHGTGRVIFRNTRKALKGFPKRLVVPHVLTYSNQLPEKEQKERLNKEFKMEYLNSDEAEISYDLRNDSRINWLVSLLKELKGEKVLLICRSKEKVDAIYKGILNVLNVEIGIFHEDLSLIQRDRNAAYFADKAGAQILLCSEIGSEGRNFQFAHHLVLFDLPFNPELLEQRIGRLDRIGQRKAIQLHVPYFEGIWTELLFLWHHQSLNGLEHSLIGGHLYHEAYKDSLIKHCGTLANRQCKINLEFGEFLRECKEYRKKAENALEEGQDSLIAINSHRPAKANDIVAQISDWDSSEALEELMHQLFDFFGVTVEKLEHQRYFVKPEHLYTESFPSLPEEGIQLSFNRQASLSREDLTFLTWDHPMVRGAIDLMLGGEFGNASIVRTKIFEKSLPVLLFECIYVLESVAPLKFHVDRFLPPCPIRTIVDSAGKSVAKKLSTESLNNITINEEAFRLDQSPELLRSLIPNLLDSSRDLASKRQLAILAEARDKAESSLGGELKRLLELKKVNANITNKEVSIAKKELTAVLEYIEDSDIRLDSVRLVINRPNH